MVAQLQYIPGAKLIITKSCGYRQRKDVVCEELTAVADIPQLLTSPKRNRAILRHSYRIASTVLTFVEKDESFPFTGCEAFSECYIAGDPTGSIRVNFPEESLVPPKLEGGTYVVLDAAVVPTRGRIYLEILKDTRIVPCSPGSEAHVRHENDISCNLLCTIQVHDEALSISHIT